MQNKTDSTCLNTQDSAYHNGITLSKRIICPSNKESGLNVLIPPCFRLIVSVSLNTEDIPNILIACKPVPLLRYQSVA